MNIQNIYIYAIKTNTEEKISDAKILLQIRYHWTIEENITEKKGTGTMTLHKQLTAIIEREGSEYVSFCPEYDIVSQGETIEDAHKNLREALELFFETASPHEVQKRFHGEVYVTQVEVAFG